MKILPVMLLVAMLGGCAKPDERVATDAAEHIQSLPVGTLRRMATACDALLLQYAPSEEQHVVDPSDHSVDAILTELGVTRLQYGGRLDWEPFWVFLWFTPVTNLWDDTACMVQWKRVPEDHNKVNWKKPGVLQLRTPFALQAELWKGLGKEDGQPSPGAYSGKAADGLTGNAQE
jgi:hypothetical protein